ncbi:Tumor necrosis factor receptor superfamily member 16 [Chelonia mydas]|uniref:Tumor necrosis factor receptor superfamily member 16 n=1 Tax=Chelonia mydas TaxID=8469 RepID=M7AXN5_CHEMY|nr:Tumor necrosis factor receptor superfamily member 16 [Chelonia mydas]
MIRACSPVSDTLCMDRELQILKRTEGDPRKDHPKKPPLSESEGSASPNNSSHFLPPLPDNSKNIIPVYCSILAAVVVGLLAYVAFKWYVWPGSLGCSSSGEGVPGESPQGVTGAAQRRPAPMRGTSQQSKCPLQPR